MRQNICIILNSKSRKDTYKELHETLNLYKENENLITEYVSYFTKEDIEKRYEGFKQKYRELSCSEIEYRLKEEECDNIEEYINCVLEAYDWKTLEDYAFHMYNIIRFEGEKGIGVYNPKGYIDYVDGILECRKYRKLTSKKLKNYGISEVILPNNTEVEWDMDKDYKSNKIALKQAINRHADKNTYMVNNFIKTIKKY